MIGPNSRYANVAIARMSTTRNGLPVEVRYLRRRSIPGRTQQLGVVEHVIQQGDRLDNLTAQFLTDPTQFWRLCDFNVVLRPTELTDTPGLVIEIALPLPGAPGAE